MMEKNSSGTKALQGPAENPKKIGRRALLTGGAMAAGAIVFPWFFSTRAFGAQRRAYELAAESLLPGDIRQAPVKVREAYRFASANREILRYIPCYCGCGDVGHTSNASCYLKDSSTPGKLIFDRMSLN